MKQKCTRAAVLLAAAMLLTACTKDTTGSGYPGDSAEESSAAETTEQTTETTAPETTESSAETTEQTTESSVDESSADECSADESSSGESSAEDSSASAGDVKILWSERGLEAVAADSKDGYGEELKTGAKYLDWTLDSLSGTPKDLEADFTYNGTLTANGILTVLPSSHADYPNGLYLRVDNQADFPFFPQDTRERGKFIIENAEDIWEPLGLDAPPVSSEYTVAVTVSVTSLHVHYAPGAYDTIRVSSASKR